MNPHHFMMLQKLLLFKIHHKSWMTPLWTPLSSSHHLLGGFLRLVCRLEPKIKHWLTIRMMYKLFIIIRMPFSELVCLLSTPATKGRILLNSSRLRSSDQSKCNMLTTDGMIPSKKSFNPTILSKLLTSTTTNPSFSKLLIQKGTSTWTLTNLKNSKKQCQMTSPLPDCSLTTRIKQTKSLKENALLIIQFTCKMEMLLWNWLCHLIK